MLVSSALLVLGGILASASAAAFLHHLPRANRTGLGLLALAGAGLLAVAAASPGFAAPLAVGYALACCACALHAAHLAVGHAH